jgi:hypothetical protein
MAARCSAALILALVTATLFAACGDDSYTRPNAPPSILNPRLIACADEVCELRIDVVDANADPVDLEVSCEAEAGPSCAVSSAPGSDGVSGLIPDTAPPGRGHTLLLALDGPQAGARLRVTLQPTDARGLPGYPISTPWFDL